MAARNRAVLLAVAASLPAPVAAGPPFETDDPFTTTPGSWEVYVFADGGGQGAEFDGTSGIDVNYGIAADLQATLTVPVHLSSAADISVNAVDIAGKYRFLNDTDSGLSGSVAAIVTVPIAAGTEGRVEVRLPVWLGWSRGPWFFYGGGGPSFLSDGMQSGWFAGAVATYAFPGGTQLGLEAVRRVALEAEESSETGLKAGVALPLARSLTLLAAGGPRWRDGDGMHYGFYLALAATF